MAATSPANVFAAVINLSGTILAQTANRAADSALVTVNAIWSPPWTSSFTPAAGYYYGVVLIGTGTTTAPQFKAGPSSSALPVNFGTTAGAGNLRVANAGGGNSALPGSINMATLAASSFSMWGAIT